MFMKPFVTVLAIAILALGTFPAWAQDATGSINGIVTDQDGGTVSRVSIQAKNVNTGTIYKATSSNSGNYQFEGLPAGSYQISLPTIGLGSPPQNVVVQAGQASRLDIRARDASLNTLGEDRSFFASVVAPHSTPTGPAPRTPEGNPDLSGVWWSPRILDRGEPSLLPWAAAVIKEWAASNLKDVPSSRCLPSGVALLHYFGLNKLVQTPTLLVSIGEADVAASRQIFLDGRGHPKDMDPTWAGHSIGKWEGDTLVVDTIGFNGKSWIADTISAAAVFPYTEKLHLTSRFRRPDLGHLEVDVTFDDPGTFTKPWTMKTVSDLAQGEEVQEMICNENNQDVQHLVGK
jgi:hypothetical protein